MSDAVEEIRSLFRDRGDDHYEEDISQEQHALEVTAALLHDVGHLLVHRHSTEEDLKHEEAGAAWLAARFPEAVAAPVRLHVDAKPYLVHQDPSYHERLSAASRTSLRLQGGPFSNAQAARFIEQPYAAEALAVRRWDDAAKAVEVSTPGLDHFLELCVAPLAKRHE